LSHNEPNMPLVDFKTVTEFRKYFARFAHFNHAFWQCENHATLSQSFI